MTTPIDALPMDQNILKKIKELKIGSLEELFSLYTALKDQPGVLSKSLGIDQSRLGELMEKVKECLPAGEVQELSEKPPAEEMPLGAVNSDIPVDKSSNKSKEEEHEEYTEMDE